MIVVIEENRKVDPFQHIRIVEHSLHCQRNVRQTPHCIYLVAMTKIAVSGPRRVECLSYLQVHFLASACTQMKQR